MRDRRRTAWIGLAIVLSVGLGIAGARMPQEVPEKGGYTYSATEYQYQDTVLVVFRAEVQRLHDCYYDAMVMTPWRITVEFWSLDDDILAQTGANPPYWNATIRYDLEALSEEDPSDVRGTVIHELFHVLSWELGLVAESAANTRVEFDHALDLQEDLATRVEMFTPLVATCG